MEQLNYFMMIQGITVAGIGVAYAAKVIQDNGGLVWSVRFAREAVAVGVALVIGMVR